MRRDADEGVQADHHPGLGAGGGRVLPLDFEQPEPFADDELISGWARNSVYFMVANGIINGIGNHLFAPRNTTPREEAIGYATASREQALVIATRMVRNLKQPQ